MENIKFVIFVLFLPYNVWAISILETCSGDMPIECATGEIIIIHINQAERFHGDEDCRVFQNKKNEVLEKEIWDLCSGKKSCVIPFKFKMEDLEYLQVYYDCGVRYNLCEDVEIAGNTSYLESSSKVQNIFSYTSKQICFCEATFDSGRNISVSFTDNMFNTSKAHVKIYWDNKTRIVDNTTVNKDANNLYLAKESFKVIFEAGAEAGGGHFQLKYQTTTPITMVCNPGTDNSPKLLLFLLAPIAFVCLLIIIAVVICIVKRGNAARRRIRAKDVVERPNPGTPDYATRASFASYTESTCSCEDHESYYDHPKGNIYIGMDRRL